MQAAPPASGSDSSKAAPSRPPTPQEIDAAAKAEKERLANMAKAKAAAIPFLKTIIEKYPKSPHVPEAAYQLAVLQYSLCEAGIDATGKPLPPEKLDQAWKDVAASLAKFCEMYPKSLFAGDAYVRQVDLALEQQFDLPAAMLLSEKAIQWAKAQGIQLAVKADGTVTRDALADAAKTIKDASVTPPAWVQPSSIPPASLLNDMYNVYLRAGILAYLQEKYDDAAKHMEAAGPARPTDGMQANFDIQKIGLYILKNSCTRKQPAWYPEAVAAAKTDSQKLALKLADTYMHAQRPEKAEDIYQQIIDGRPAFGPRNPSVEGYCLMQLALSYSSQNIHPEKSLEYYKRFYNKEYAGQPWAADAIMRLAVLEYNTSQDPKQSIPHYQHILATYPNHPEAERALYFLALDAVQLGDKSLAESSCKAFLEKYPQSGWKLHIQTLLKQEIPKLKTELKGTES